MSDSTLDVFSHNTLNWTWAGRDLVVEIPEDVFSTFQIDVGTRQLLKQIAQTGRRWGRALDVGCGYGPIGLALAAGGLAAEVRGIDRDALAAAFARRNAARNGVPVEFVGGVAYDDAGAGPFDLIVTNLPAKAGDAVHQLLLLGASNHLTAGGDVWAVVVRPLAGRVDELLNHPDVEPRHRSEAAKYVVYNYGFRRAIPVTGNPYVRDTVTYDYDGVTFDIDAFEGVSDFDSIWMGTDLALQFLLRRRPPLRRVSVYEPTQGQLPVLLTKLWPEISSVALASRDALALRASEANLRQNGFGGEVRTSHSAHAGGLPAETDLVVFQLNGGERTDVQVRRLADAYTHFDRRPMVVASPASLGGRIEAALNKLSIRSPEQVNRKGFRVVRYG